MLQYVNGFMCSFNPSEQLMIIKMQQSEPVPNDENESDEIQMMNNPVSSLIMSREMALKLSESIAQLIEDRDSHKAE